MWHLGHPCGGGSSSRSQTPETVKGGQRGPTPAARGRSGRLELAQEVRIGGEVPLHRGEHPRFDEAAETTVAVQVGRIRGG